MKIKPYAGYVLVEEEDQTTQFKSGIEIKEDEKQSVIGKVVAIPKSKIIITDMMSKVAQTTASLTEILQYLGKELKIGDRVVFKKYTGNEIEFEDKKYQLIAYADILAVIK